MDRPLPKERDWTYESGVKSPRTWWPLSMPLGRIMVSRYTGGAIWALIPEVFEDLTVAV